jgi:transposase InsO family protein
MERIDRHEGRGRRAGASARSAKPRGNVDERHPRGPGAGVVGERLMRQAGIEGVTRRRRRRGCTRRDLNAIPSDDLVVRRFRLEGPDRLWVADITEHPTDDGKVYAAVVIDAWSRLVVGWAIADHLRAELVVAALDMARWRRRPQPGQTIHHSDHGTQYTAWAFGQRLRHAGLMGSMGTVGDALDRGRRELLRHAADRAPRPSPLGHPPRARPGDLRMDRGLLQQPAAALHRRHAHPCLLRQSPPHRVRGMISITTHPLSGEAGELQSAGPGGSSGRTY